jgi:hypothetical protein
MHSRFALVHFVTLFCSVLFCSEACCDDYFLVSILITIATMPSVRRSEPHHKRSKCRGRVSVPGGEEDHAVFYASA